MLSKNWDFSSSLLHTKYARKWFCGHNSLRAFSNVLFFSHDTILLHLLPGVFGDEGFFNENQVVCWKFWSKWRKLRLHRIRSNQKKNKGKWNCGHVGNIRNCECGKIIGCPALKSLLCFISYSKKNLKSWLPEFGTPALLEWSSTDTKQ